MTARPGGREVGREEIPCAGPWGEGVKYFLGDRWLILFTEEWTKDGKKQRYRGEEGNLSNLKYGPVKNKVGVNPTFESKFNETNGGRLGTRMRKMYKKRKWNMAVEVECMSDKLWLYTLLAPVHSLPNASFLYVKKVSREYVKR